MGASSFALLATFVFIYMIDTTSLDMKWDDKYNTVLHRRG